MKHDFDTLVSRKKLNSTKWDAMYQDNPNVPDGVVPFSTADMELKNPPEIIEGLKKYLDEEILGYAGPNKGFNQSVVAFLKRRHNWEIQPEWIQTAEGVVNAIFEAILAFTKPGDGVILFTPVYYPFYMAITENNRQLVSCSLVDNNGHYEINWEDFEAKAKQANNKALLLCSPHNPVGRVWTKEELTRLSRICLDNDILMLSDEIHFDLLMPGYQHTMLASISDEVADRTVTFSAPSKTFNLAGMCASYMIVKNPELRKQLADEMMKVCSGWCLGILSYKACELAYTQCDAWLEEVNILIDTNRRYVEDFMKDNIPEIKVYPMEGTYLQWWDCRGMGLDDKALDQFMKREAFLYLDEGIIFGQEGSGFQRINLACPTHVLVDAMARLKKAMAKLPAYK